MSEEPNDERPEQPISSDGIVISERAADVVCPRCNREMFFGELLKTKVVVCSICQGVVIQCGELGALVELLRRDYAGSDDPPRPLDPQELEVAVPCPACGSTMEVHPYGGPGNIVIDSCAECQIVWLDGAELSRIIRGSGRR